MGTQAGSTMFRRVLAGRAGWISGLAERVSAHTIADRADRIRSHDDIEAIRVPAGAADLRTRRIKMYRQRGRDLIVANLHEGWRQFEAPLLDLFLAEVRAGTGWVFDVGANTGLYSLLAASAGADRVVAFEPYPPVLALLRANLALNSVSRRITVQPVAVSDSPGSATLYIPPPSPNNPVETSASLSAEFKGGEGEQVEVDVRTLDQCWSEAGRPPVSVVKIDVESREYSVLSGAQELISATRPVIIYELLPAGDDAAIQEFADRNDLVDAFPSPVEVVFNAPVQHQPHAWNHLLIPREKLPAVKDRFARLGLMCTVLD